jgi:hypothetical protein
MVPDDSRMIAMESVTEDSGRWMAEAYCEIPSFIQVKQKIISFVNGQFQPPKKKKKRILSTRKNRAFIEDTISSIALM